MIFGFPNVSRGIFSGPDPVYVPPILGAWIEACTYASPAIVVASQETTWSKAPNTEATWTEVIEDILDIVRCDNDN